MIKIEKYIDIKGNKGRVISKAITDLIKEFSDRADIKKLKKIQIYVTKDPLKITKKIILPKTKLRRHGEIREWIFQNLPSFSYLAKGKTPSIMINANEKLFEGKNYTAMKGLFAHELMHIMNKIDGIEDELEDEAEEAASKIFYYISKHKEVKPFTKERLLASFVRVTTTALLLIKDVLANSRAMSFGFDEEIYEYYKESNSDAKEKMKFTEKSIMRALKKDQKHVLDDAFLAYLGLNNIWVTFKMFHHDKWTRKLKNMSNIEVPKIIKNNARYVLNELCLIRSGENKKQIAKVLRVTQEKYFNVVRYFCKRLR